MSNEMPDGGLIAAQSPVLGGTNVRHGFFGRRGGVGVGLYASLNCGFGSSDRRADIAQNRERCAAFLEVGAASLVSAHQVHGINVVEVTRPWRPDGAPRADGMVSAQPGIALGILTADCAPILLVDSGAGVIGAAHAGWKGAKAGIADAVVSAMIRLGAARTRIVACVGPAIGAASYEVGHEFRAAFLADDPLASRFFIQSSGELPHFDLPRFVVARLEDQGLAAVDLIDADTYADRDGFFSYRRSCHRGEVDYGRQLSAILLRSPKEQDYSAATV